MRTKSIVMVLLLVLACMAVYSPRTSAEEAKIDLKQTAGIKDILTDNIGKRVSLRIDAGEILEGTVTSVGDSLVHIAKLSGKDFYDAVVRIDKINAVIIRARSN